MSPCRIAHLLKWIWHRSIPRDLSNAFYFFVCIIHKYPNSIVLGDVGEGGGAAALDTFQTL